MTTTYYTFRHFPGHGRDDHMADEIIARAARRLGLDTDARIRQHIGFASHSVPMGGIVISVPVARGAKARMLRALRAAKAEITAKYISCLVAVVKEREADGRVEWYSPSSRAWITG